MPGRPTSMATCAGASGVGRRRQAGDREPRSLVQHLQNVPRVRAQGGGLLLQRLGQVQRLLVQPGNVRPAMVGRSPAPFALLHRTSGRESELYAASVKRATVVEACRARVAQPLTIQPAAKADPRKPVRTEARRAATKPVADARKPSTDAVKTSSPKSRAPAAAARRWTGSAVVRRAEASSGAAGAAKPRSGSSAAAPRHRRLAAGAAEWLLRRRAINRNALIGGGGSPERIR